MLNLGSPYSILYTFVFILNAVDPVFGSAVAPLVVPSICGGGSCPLALGPVAAGAALVPTGWVSFSLSLRLLARWSHLLLLSTASLLYGCCWPAATDSVDYWLPLPSS